MTQYQIFCLGWKLIRKSKMKSKAILDNLATLDILTTESMIIIFIDLCNPEEPIID